MVDGIISVGVFCVLFTGCAVVAGVILAARDARLYRLQQEQRPLEDRIADVRTDAAFMAQQLEDVLDRREPQADWIPPVLAYYRRLEAFATAPDASAEEIDGLADEALSYVREHRLKGIFVAQAALQLAALVRRRNVES